MSIIQKLANIHSSSGVYSSKSLHDESGNILVELREHSDLGYLTTFYDQYIKNYDITIANEINDERARSKDLFFIGQEVIKTGKAKFFFVFEGSRSSAKELSITVLSHLWTMENKEVIERFCGRDKWWTLSNYFYMKKKLNVNKGIADHSYVIDALRIGSPESINKNKLKYKLNRDLIYTEIALLKPTLVICVGKAAQEIVGMKYLEQNTKFHAVKFPKYHNDTDGYKELSAIMESLIF